MTGPAPIGLAAVLLAAAPAFAGRAHLPAPADAVRWRTPPAAALAAGGTLLVAWEPGPGFDRMAAVEEWELFLSYDGGATWPVRLTPHLDVALRSYTAELPPIASDDARLLMRLGDERLEYEVELPDRLRIAPPSPGRRASLDRPWLVATRGESARPGARGVALWSHGARDGRDARWFAARSASASLSPVRLSALVVPPTLAPPERPATALASPPTTRTDTVRTTRALESPVAPRAATLTPLASTCRRNE